MFSVVFRIQTQICMNPRDLCLCLWLAGQLLWQRVRGGRPSRRPGGAFARKTEAQGQGCPSTQRCFQTFCTVQVSSWVQGRRKKPLTRLPSWPASLPEMLCLWVSELRRPCCCPPLAPLLRGVPSASLLLALFSWWLFRHLGSGSASVSCICETGKGIVFYVLTRQVWVSEKWSNRQSLILCVLSVKIIIVWLGKLPGI